MLFEILKKIKGLFSNCINLINIDLPELYFLDSGIDCCFYNCYSLESINAPKLEAITDELFSYCYALKEINIPNAKTIGEKAFYYTSALKEVYFEFATEIDDMAFLNSSVESVNVPGLKFKRHSSINLSEYRLTAIEMHINERSRELLAILI